MTHPVRRLADRIKAGLLGLRPPAGRARFVQTADAASNAAAIFDGEWASALPATLGVRAGSIPLFEDERLRWMAGRLPVADRSVLELGPLEGGHTWLLEQLGAARILALEANTRAYLKCLVVKELLDIRRARFLCVDFMAWLRAAAANPASERFDLCLASGVLYHQCRPLDLLGLIGRVADRLYLWTHYYDAARIGARRDLAFRFAPGEPAEAGGFRHTLYRRSYGAGWFSRRSFGGSARTSCWLTRADILGALAHFGWTGIEVNFEQPDHPHGPCFALIARRAFIPTS